MSSIFDSQIISLIFFFSTFIIALDFKTLIITEGVPENPEAVLTIEDDLLLACANQETTLLDCIKEKKAEITGDIELFKKFNDKFPKKN